MSPHQSPPVARVSFDATDSKPARLVPPLSKSDAQRALALAYALGAPSLVTLPPDDELPGDVVALGAGLRTLRDAPTAGATIHCGEGGAPLRILVGQAAVTPGAHLRLWGSARLAERPHGPLLDALRATLGPAGLVLAEGAPWPLTVRGARRAVDAGAARFFIASSASSQYATSALLAAATLVVRERRPWTVELGDATASQGYLDLTLAWLARMGFTVDVRPGALRVTGVVPRAVPVVIPSDWSSIAYLLLAAWRTGGTVAKVDLDAAHPDRAVLQVLAQAGLAIEARPSGEVAVVGTPRAGVHASGDECPDLLPTVAALACVLPAPSTLSALAVLRHKESDRVQGIEELVRAAGAKSSLVDDRLIIEPGRVPARIELQSRGDHRMVMAAATLAVLARSTLTVDDGACVAKSFPGFWRELAKLGAVVPASGEAPG